MFQLQYLCAISCAMIVSFSKSLTLSVADKMSQGNGHKTPITMAQVAEHRGGDNGAYTVIRNQVLPTGLVNDRTERMLGAGV